MTQPYSKEMNINAWAEMFKDIYFPTQNYNRSKLDIFAHLIKVYGGGSRYLFRTHNAAASKEFLAKIFGWYCALANRLDVDIENSLWKKYPGVCPRCQLGVCGCTAPLKEIDPIALNQIAEKNKGQKPRTLRQWQTMLGNIYRGPAVIKPQDRLAVVFSRMAEELGEVAEAIQMDSVIDNDVQAVIENEMADLCAWIFALANSLHLVDPEMEGTTLADVTWNLYGGKCHRCMKVPCACAPGSLGLELAGRGAMGPAHWDELTRLANASGLKVKFAELDKKFAEDGTTETSIIMLDLDNFGLVNKTHGNLVGDHVLRETAARMQGVLLDGAIPFRRGGEEFVITMSGSFEDAQMLAEDIRKAIATSPIIFSSASDGDVSLDVTASFGVANTLKNKKKPSALEAIADDLMRSAKQAGKNQVKPDLDAELVRQMLSKDLYL